MPEVPQAGSVAGENRCREASGLSRLGLLGPAGAGIRRPARGVGRSGPAMRVRIDIPEAALEFGFMNEPAGAHTSRTIMLSELRGLLGAVAPAADYLEYQHAAVEMNAAHKATLSTRQKTFRHLRELYSLSSDILLFRALRDLWTPDAAGEPLLAASCAAARDPLLRVSSKRILEAPEGEEVTSEELEESVDRAFPERFRPDTLARTGRNIASSWTQSGHLQGRARKVRTRARCTATATAYALFLGYLCGDRGEGLFRTLWARLTDAPEHILRAQAAEATRLGYLEYRHGGGVTEVSFPHLLRDEARIA